MSTNLRNQMREVMNEAWQFFRVTGESFSVCLKKAWANLKLRKAMKKGIVKFYYQKVSGEIREAWGTLSDNYLPETKGENRKKNEHTQVYFDTEKQAFRSFKKLNLLSIA